MMTRYLYHAHSSGAPVIANYELKFKHRLMPFNEFAEIMATKNERLIRKNFQGAVFGWDELGVGADSYEWFEKDKQELTSIVAYIRKFDMLGYYTVQRHSMVARRLRIMTGAFIFMEDADKGIMVDRDGKRARRHKDICAGIFWAQMTNDFMEPIGDRQPFNGRKYWDLYDTDKVIWV